VTAYTKTKNCVVLSTSCCCCYLEIFMILLKTYLYIVLWVNITIRNLISALPQVWLAATLGISTIFFDFRDKNRVYCNFVIVRLALGLKMSSTTPVSYETCPTSAPFFGFMGVTAALCFASKCVNRNNPRWSFLNCFFLFFFRHWGCIWYC
jgi:hypothetical protein